MSRIIVTLGLAVIALAGIAHAQSKADFSGRWELVADKSTPATSAGVFGKAVGIKQTETSMTLESTVTGMRGSSVNGQMVTEPVEGTLTSEYIFDGAEHELQQTNSIMQNIPAGATVMSTPPPVFYRAIWTTGQLVIVSQTKAGPTSSTDAPGTLQRVTRVALSLDSDGSLVVDAIAITAPRAGAAKQNAPTPMRTVYAKK